MTVAVLDKLVLECLGVVPVLCIVGKARSGKTWAAEDWFAIRKDDNDLAGYLDCQGSGFGGPGSLKVGGVLRALRSDDYPKFALDGVDIVVVDEGQFRPGLVNKLIENTAPEAGTAKWSRQRKPGLSLVVSQHGNRIDPARQSCCHNPLWGRADNGSS